jgi:murein DD-endopeptidase MepM/ murein hydrolase activator NlpD
MKRAMLTFAATFLLMTLTVVSPAQSVPTATTAPTLDHTATTPRHPGSIAAALFNDTTVTVSPGDTYGRWAITYCGTFNAWHAIQAVNGWPERRIPVGASARILCVPTANPTPAGAAWVHPLASGRRGTSCYGWRASTNSFHGGVDMPQASGTVIRAASAGTVYRRAFERGGAGFYLVLRHPGNVYTQYHHMIAASSLATGAHVSAGQTIGRVGATGNATGPHLHFEVRSGGPSSANRINPAVFMRNHGVNIGC